MSDDWTPTTETMRAVHRAHRYIAAPDGSYRKDAELFDAEFDRWLEQVKAEAWHEGYGHGRDDEEAETRTNQMHATLNPYRKDQS